MVSIIATTQDLYKSQWSSPDFYMDHSRATERSSPRHPYSAPLTDPTPLQSFLPTVFPSISHHQPLELKLPEKAPSRKRKASEVDDLAMNQHFQRPRHDGHHDGATIDPQSLTTPFTTASYMPEHYAPSIETTSPYSTWQPTPPVRTTSAPMDPNTASQYPYSYVETSPVPSSYSHRSSIASTASQSMGPIYANSFQPSYHTMPYSNQNYAQPPPPPPMNYPVSYMIPLQVPVQPPTTLESSRVPRARTQSIPQAGLPQTMQPTRSYSTTLPPPAENVRPKPQCWEHGCNGREFSTFSNLLRHQRERKGIAPRSVCPRCGAEFTRSTARTNHLLNSKCKQRRSSN